MTTTHLVRDFSVVEETRRLLRGSVQAAESKRGARLQAPNEETNLGAYWVLDWPDGGYYVVSFCKSTGAYSAKRYASTGPNSGKLVEELGDEQARGLAWFKGLYCEWRV